MKNMEKRILANLEKLPDLYSTDGVGGDMPAVYIFTPDAAATWVLWEYDPTDQIAFGLCDLGMGFPEIGSVYVPEILAVRGAFGLAPETDTRLDTRFKGYENMGLEVPDYLQA